MRLIKTHTNGNKTAKVYKDHEWGEYRVKHFTDGKHDANADYHTDDADDAHGTAKKWLGEGTIKSEDTIRKLMKAAIKKRRDAKC